MNEQHSLFPVEMQADWQAPDVFDIDPILRDWLLDPLSLTARLKRHCQHFRVQVLGQSISRCSEQEATDDINAGEQVLIREVLLFCDDKPQVFARSLLPLRSLTGAEQQLAQLGNQSLGQVLFNNPELIRKGIEISSFDQQSSVAKLAKHCQLPVTTELWGRRSIFVLHNKPLMVAEVFLPDAFAYQKTTVTNT
jgi:chorismate--pyruvate lyase